MNYRSSKWIMLIGSAAIGGFFSPTAQAQTSASESVTGDIIVTARRVEERLQDVPISMTVYSQEELSKRNIVIASDLATYTPSLQVDQRYGPEKSSFSIRGFNQEISTAPTVATYFADVVALRALGGTTSGDNAGAGAFMDLQNVQVLKGPQGTLFGRNTDGGAVLLVPQKPTGRLEGYIEGSVGSYNLRRIQGVLNVPLADTFRIRLAADRNSRDGHMRNRSSVGPDHYNNVDYVAARLSIVGDLTPDLENYTVVQYSNSFGHGYAAHLEVCDRTYDPNSPTYILGQPLSANPSLRPNLRKVLVTGPACAQIDRQAARGDGKLDVEVNNPDPYQKITQWQIINTTTWQANDWLTIKNIMSYGEFRERSSFELDSGNFSIRAMPNTSGDPRLDAFAIPASHPAVGLPIISTRLDPSPTGDNASQSTFTEELRLQGNLAGGSLVWQAGAYFERSRPIGFNEGYNPLYLVCTDVQALACRAPLFNVSAFSYTATQYSFDSTGLYGQATYEVVNGLSLTGGIRYTIDKTSGITENTRYFFDPSGVTMQQCNDALNFPQPGTNPPQGKIVNNRSECQRGLTVKSQKPTWLVSVDFKPTNDLLIYAKYSRGYRQGGINFTNVGVESWGPEKVDAYEVGAKASFNGAIRGYFNVAGFYNDFSEQQLFTALIANPVSGVAGGAGIFNAGSSRIMGVEVDASATLFNSLRLDVGYTYLDTKLLSAVVPPATYPYILFLPLSNVGDPLTYSPKNRVAASANYTLPLDDSIGDISVGATFIHTGRQLHNARAVFPYLPASNLVNLNINWDSVMGSPIDAALFITNVTDERYAVASRGSFATGGVEGRMYGFPRMWGLRVKYRFGE